MHVVLKRRGVTLRAVWDGLAKPAEHQTKHWVRLTPVSSRLNTDFLREGNVALVADDLTNHQHTVMAVTANLVTVNMTSAARGTYDLSTADHAISADTTRSAYSTRFIVGMLGSSWFSAPSTTDTYRPTESTVRMQSDAVNETTSAVTFAIERLTVAYLNRDTALTNTSKLQASTYTVISLSLAHSGISDTPSTLAPSNEYVDDAYILKAVLPNHALFEEDDPQQYSALDATDPNALSVTLNEESTVPDFFKSARITPTMFYMGGQLNGGDGQSSDALRPIVRVKSAAFYTQFTGNAHDSVLISSN